MDLHPGLLIDAQAVLGEGPAWAANEGKLYWVDIEGKRLHYTDPSSGTDLSWDLPEMVCCAVPRASGGLVLALTQRLVFFDPQNESIETICELETSSEAIRFNDGKCDPAGRFWVGTMNMRSKEPLGNLYCLDREHQLSVKIEQVTISNGITWTPEYTRMYYIDTPTRQVVAYDYDKDSGDISGKRVAINVPESMGLPDGMTADREGMLWIAHWGGNQIVRWDPSTGKPIASYALPVRNVTSSCFGGDDLNELYITTARTGNTNEELRDQPHAGGLFHLQTDVQGQETFAFQG